MSVMDKVNVFQELADVLPFGVAVVAVDGTILYWNRAAERIRGYRSHEIVARRCGSDSLSARCESGDPSFEAESCPLRPVLRDGQALTARVLASHRDGHRLPLRMQALPLHDERGELVAVAEIFAEHDGNGAANWIDCNRSGLHPTLGIPAVSATEEQLKRQLLESSSALGVFLIGVDGLDEAVKRYGTGIRAVALRALAQTLVCVVGPTYFIGNWTADRFLVIVRSAAQRATSR